MKTISKSTAAASMLLLLAAHQGSISAEAAYNSWRLRGRCCSLRDRSCSLCAAAGRSASWPTLRTARHRWRSLHTIDGGRGGGGGGRGGTTTVAAAIGGIAAESERMAQGSSKHRGARMHRASRWRPYTKQSVVKL